MAKQKVGYVDGFVLTVPKPKLAAYRKLAAEGGKMWMGYGALAYKECVIDDAKPQWVTFTFAKMVKAKPNEVVWFSYIEYQSKKHRDTVNKKVMAEMEKSKEKYKDMQMPFDMKRMAHAGFKVMIDA
jgi:uncharacterized protein YbaA (DUF1428 family)